jgi:hypothetical protein
VQFFMSLENAIFWDVVPRGFIINQRFGGAALKISNPTHYVSATKPRQLMLFRVRKRLDILRTVQNTDTLCRQNAVLLC